MARSSELAKASYGSVVDSILSHHFSAGGSEREVTKWAEGAGVIQNLTSPSIRPKRAISGSITRLLQLLLLEIYINTNKSVNLMWLVAARSRSYGRGCRRKSQLPNLKKPCST
jgi:hypothetical protein